QKLRWLPEPYMSGTGADYARSNFARAVHLRYLFKQPFAGPEQVFVSGDAFATKLYLYAPKDNPDWQNWQMKVDRGDGTVPVWSASDPGKPFGTISGTFASTMEHPRIFSESNVKEVLLRELIGRDLPPVVSL